MTVATWDLWMPQVQDRHRRKEEGLARQLLKGLKKAIKQKADIQSRYVELF